MGLQCGIVGLPNVGKSTLMNHLIGQKVSIVSRKPQTTQHRIRGVFTENNYQFVFVDTPGFQKKYINKFNLVLNQSVINSLNGVDAILFVVEAGICNVADLEVISLLPKTANVILVVNKIDKLKDKINLDKFVATISEKYPFKQIKLVAAKHHTGIVGLVDSIKPCLPNGEFLYPEDHMTDRSSSFLASEIIREKLFRSLGEELPYSVAVEIDEFKVEAKIIHISATILVDKDNQKGMVIGQGGGKLKKISTEARIDMESLFAKQVFLQVWVKVKQGFADEAKFLAQFE